MEIIVVSDTNILIDLIEAGVLEKFFLLPMKVHTTDIVISEVTVPEQKAQVRILIQTRCLTVKTYTPDEMQRLIEFVNSRRITLLFLFRNSMILIKQWSIIRKH